MDVEQMKQRLRDVMAADDFKGFQIKVFAADCYACITELQSTNEWLQHLLNIKSN